MTSNEYAQARVPIIRWLMWSLGSVPPFLYLAILVMALVPLMTTDFYLMEIMVLMIIYAQFAGSWDILSGQTEQPNFGHALFIGGAAYIAALLNLRLALPPVLTLPIAGAVAALVGLGIGWLTLRLRGPYFALSTIVFSAVLFKLTYILWPITGGEEGLSGVQPFTATVDGDLFVCLGIFLLSTICMGSFRASGFGLILRSTRHNEEAAEASGINTAYYKIVGFAVSGFFAGIAGAMYVHTHMQVNPGMLAGSLSVFIVLFATIGGSGTLFGPIVATAVLVYLDQWLRIVEEYRIVLFSGLLIALVYLHPSGFGNSKSLARLPLLKRFLIGRNA